MAILMSALTPHPPLAIPQIGRENRLEVRDTIESMEELAREIKEKDPDLLITISPHGPVFADAISILNLEKLQGDFADFACPEVKIIVETDQEFISKLKENAVKEEVELITLGEADLARYNYPPRLDHGVMVPLYFILETGLDVPVIPITMGLLEYEKLFRFGGVIDRIVEEMGLRAIIIASGDLSHRLKPGAPAGYNPYGEKFDRELIELLRNRQYRAVLEMDQLTIEKAGECGLRPTIIMLGAIDRRNFSSEVKSYEGPFGVGYAVVGFYPEE